MGETAAHIAQPVRPWAQFPLVAALALFAIMMWLFWVGFIGSDDSLYWASAEATLRHFPYVGDTHWALRHTLVLPLALAWLILGDGVVAISTPTLLYAGATIAVLAFWLRRVARAEAVMIALAVTVTNPLLVVWSSMAAIDIVEVFFVFAAFALYARAVAYGPTAGMLLGCGLLMGCAYLSRETAAFAVAAFGVLFLVGYGFPRRWYFVIALGFAVLVGAELVYLWAITGNPWHRLAIAADHDSTINRWAPSTGVSIALHPAVDPLVMLLSNHYFALLAWIGVPLSIWLFARGGLTGALRQAMTILATVGLVWTVAAAALWTQLPLIPRYFLPPSICVSVLAGVAVWRLVETGKPRRAAVLGALLVLGNLSALILENKNFRFGEWALADIMAATPGVIHTDPETQARAALLLHWRGVETRVVVTPAQPGDLVFYNSIEAGLLPPPGKDWQILTARAPPPTWLQRLLAPLSGRIPPSIWEKLGPRHLGVTLYRVS